MTPAGASPSPDAQPDLPPGWRWVRLEEVIREAQLGFASGKRDPGGVAQLRMNNVTNRGRLDWSSIIRVPADSEIIATYRLEPGDVVFNNTNSTDLVGKTALFEGHDEPVTFSNHFTRLRVAPDKLSPAFLAFWLQEQWQRRVFEYICNRWIGQSAVQRDKLLSLEIPLPPLEEQKRIAAILNEQMAAVERARASAETQLEAARALPAAHLRAIFNSPEAQHWPKKHLGELGEIVSGITLGRKVWDTQTRPVPYLRVANVKDGYLDLSNVHKIEATETEIEKLRLKFGDLLLTEGGDPDKLGRGTFWGEQIPECIHQNHIFRVRFGENAISSQFVAAQIGSPYGKAYFLAHAKQTTGIATINQKVLSEFPLMLPPLAQQERIVACLSEQVAAAEKTRKALEEQFRSIAALPAALLRRAFRGEL